MLMLCNELTINIYMDPIFMTIVIYIGIYTKLIFNSNKDKQSPLHYYNWMETISIQYYNQFLIEFLIGILYTNRHWYRWWYSLTVCIQCSNHSGNGVNNLRLLETILCIFCLSRHCSFNSQCSMHELGLMTR